MPIFNEQELNKINNGEPVEQEVLNRPSKALLEMVNYLSDIIVKLFEIENFDIFLRNSSNETILLTPLIKGYTFTIGFSGGEYVLNFTKPLYLFWKYDLTDGGNYIIRIEQGSQDLGGLENPVYVYILGNVNLLSNIALSQSIYGGRSVERNIKVGEVAELVKVSNSLPEQVDQGDFYIGLFKIAKQGNDVEITYLTKGFDISGLDGIYTSWLKEADVNVIRALSSYINNVSGFLRNFFTPGVVPTTGDFTDCRVSLKTENNRKYVVVSPGAAIMPDGTPVFVSKELKALLSSSAPLGVYLTYDTYFNPYIAFSPSTHSIKLAQIGAGDAIEDSRVRSKFVIPTSAVFRSFYSLTDGVDEGELRYSKEGKVFGYASSKDVSEFDVLATLSRVGIVQHVFYKPSGEQEFITSGGGNYVVLPPCTLIRWDARNGGGMYQGANVSLVFNQTVSFTVWYDEEHNLYAGTEENNINLSGVSYSTSDITITFTFALHLVTEFK